MEIWRDIPEWEGLYQASNQGRVRSLGRLVKFKGGALRKIKGTVLRGALNQSTGYITVMLTNGPNRKCRSIHRLVCNTFHGQPPTQGHQAAHIDGNKTNNAPENLVWATGKENTSHRYAHGTVLFGEAHPLSKLNEQAVRSIRIESRQGAKTTDLSKKHGVSFATVLDVITNRSWQHVA